jgi:uncharacterized membrane protein YfbV (UPF0208 family)
MTSWPIKYRLMSFVITVGVTLTEFAVVAIPVAAVVWLIGLASAAHLAIIVVILAATFSLSISIPTHLGSRRLPDLV